MNLGIISSKFQLLIWEKSIPLLSPVSFQGALISIFFLPVTMCNFLPIGPIWILLGPSQVFYILVTFVKGIFLSLLYLLLEPCGFMQKLVIFIELCFI